MRKLVVILFLTTAVVISLSFKRESLRDTYSRDPSRWPSPNVSQGVQWKELGVLPAGPMDMMNDSLKNIAELGKVLFFDTRLSESGKISCATCHQPELNWTDGKEKSVGHEGASTKRNSPTIQNTWFYEKLFWDGRAKDLQDQAFAPINSETEMHSDMPDVIRKLRASKGYAALFKKAYGSETITPDNFTAAIAVFEKTITSGKTSFDKFLEGDRKALSNSALRGLHIFRTKARCMNCHHGPLFSDNQFHNTGIGMGPDTDKGLYQVTQKDADIGKFKTPSLRDAMNTGPWMHGGEMKDMATILELYNQNSPEPSGKGRGLGLSTREKKDLLAFLQAISAPPVPFTRPVIPD